MGFLEMELSVGICRKNESGSCRKLWCVCLLGGAGLCVAYTQPQKKNYHKQKSERD